MTHDILEILYPTKGSPRRDEGYIWSSALSRILTFHGRRDTQVFWSKHGVMMRMPSDLQEKALALEGVRLQGPDRDMTVILQSPIIRSIEPPVSGALHSPMVHLGQDTFGSTGVAFLDGLRRQLNMLEIGKVKIQMSAKHVNIPFKGKYLLGHALTFTDLDPDTALKILRHGIGKKGNYGCGVFYAI